MWNSFKELLWKFIQDHGKVFWGGAMAGGIAIGNWIFSIPDFLNAFWVAFTMKIFATICSAAITGFVTSLITDWYKHKVKHLIFKQKTKKDERSDEERA